MAVLLLSWVILAGCEAADDGDQARERSTLPAAQARALVEALERETDPETLERAVRAGDPRLAAVLIELLWAAEVGVASREQHNARVVALERLTGQPLGASWFAWLEWLGDAQLTPPAGFDAFKARLLGRVDPRYGRWLAAGRALPARLFEVHWSGSAPGNIPALVDPPLLEAGRASYLQLHEPVLGLEVDGQARAYPLRILDWHEVVNDVVAGTAICVVSCPLCGSTGAWLATDDAGVRHRFEASGLLLRSTSLLLEQPDETLWTAVGPTLVARDPERPRPRWRALPTVLTTWSDWREQHPETTVLSLDTGHERFYVPGQPYAEYFASPGLRFPVAGRTGPLADKDHVFGVRVGSSSVAYPLERIVREGVWNDRVGSEALVLVATRGTLKARYGDPSEGLEYEVGAEVRAYRAGSRRFGPGAGPDLLLDDDGGAWRISEQALLGPAGQRAPRQSGTLAYWFAWHALFPETEVR